MIHKYSEKFVHDNRWAALAEQPIEEEGDYDLSSYVDTFSEIMHQTTLSFGIKSQTSGPSVKFPRKLTELLKRYRRYSKQYTKELRSSGVADEMTMTRYRHAKSAFKKEQKDWLRRQQETLYSRISDDFIAHDHKNVWSRLKSQVNEQIHSRSKVRGSGCMPVKDPLTGELQVNRSDVLRVASEHYERVLTYDADGAVSDKERWDKIDLGEKLPALKNLNKDLTWREALQAVRRMNRNTATGKDGVHVNVLKGLVSEECMAQLKAQNPDWRRPDHVRVDLSSSNLPEEPLTPLGKALWRALVASWKGESLPDTWHETMLTHLPKPGNTDPENLDNYCGISLLSVVLKILLQIMTERLQGDAEAANLIAPEQSGFRKREETIAQFLALAETVRRRHLQGLPTVGVFVDFKKAYDRVPHGALYRVLEHIGVRGKFLNMVKHIYDNAKVAVQIDGLVGNAFRMSRGTKQGCPLSPLLFILFINRILQKSSVAGVSVPGVQQNLAGGLYADDLIALEETVTAAQNVCLKLYEWGKRWGMELGISKCGVMLWSSDDSIHMEFEAARFPTPAGEIPKVEEYKYLGIWVDSTLIDHRNGFLGGASLEIRNSKLRAKEGLKALFVLRPLFSDKRCPIPLKVALIRNLIMSLMLYGSEWTGFRQTHAAPLQRVVNIAIRWVLGIPAMSSSFDMYTCCYELGLPTIEEEMAARRTRLHAKLEYGTEKMRTWLQILHDHRDGYKSPHPRSYVWTKSGWNYIDHLIGRQTGPLLEVRDLDGEVGYGHNVINRYATRRNVTDVEEFEADQLRLKVFQLFTEDELGTRVRNTSEESPLRPWAARARIYELHQRSNSYRSPFVENARALIVGMDREGVSVEESEEYFHTKLGLRVLDEPSLVEERLQQNKDISSSDQGRTLMEWRLVRNVRDCVLE
ncbi:unnamed protein product [Somion occarium]|uniref:Reverse transcriptase domain-containing protein n=1 Tax=Somion occarium TaxID=3059160 RepID=A0ABP1D6H7_9APHY